MMLVFILFLLCVVSVTAPNPEYVAFARNQKEHDEYSTNMDYDNYGDLGTSNLAFDIEMVDEGSLGTSIQMIDEGSLGTSIQMIDEGSLGTSIQMMELKEVELGSSFHAIIRDLEDVGTEEDFLKYVHIQGKTRVSPDRTKVSEVDDDMPVINRPKKVRILSKETDNKQYSFSDTEDQYLQNALDITYSGRKLQRKVFTSTPKKHGSKEELLLENIESSREQQNNFVEDEDHNQVSFVSNKSSEVEFSLSKDNEGIEKNIGIDNHKRSLLMKAMDKSAHILQNERYSKHSCFKDKTLDFVRNSRYRFWTKDYCRRVEWFSDKFIEADIVKNKIYFITGPGEYSCGACFRKLYGINTDFFYKWIKRFSNGAVSSGYRKGRSTTSVSEDAGLWLKEYAMYRGDHLPVKGLIELQYKSRKIDIYNGYVDEQTENLKVSVSRANFYRIWKQKFKNLKIKQTNSFSRCVTCTTLTTRLEKTRNCEERAELKRKIMAHNNRQMSERNYYKEKRQRAENSKREYLNVMIDGMDQSKTNLPHFTGRRSKNSYLPEVLYIQADNCYRENKNRYMLAFCELLVRKNIFKEVQVFVCWTHTRRH